MSEIITLNISNKLYAAIEEQRGDMPRSRFITRLLEKALKLPKGDRSKYD
jgi:hypothetical protein